MIGFLLSFIGGFITCLFVAQSTRTRIKSFITGLFSRVTG